MIATPSPTTLESVSRNGFLSPVAPNRRLPLPSTTGKTMSRSSSTRSFAIRPSTSCALPWTTTSPSVSPRTCATADARSPSSTVVLPHDGSRSVEDTTYFGIWLNLSANSPSRSGHASAKPSYVLRPSSIAALCIVSSSLNWSPSSPRENSNAQPPCLALSLPPGSSITPSTDTNSLTMMRPMLSLLRSRAGSGRYYPQAVTLSRDHLNMSADHLSATFAALADPTRRAILARLADGEATVNELAAPFPMTIQAVSKHLKVLEHAGLISRGQQAQYRPCRFEAEPLDEAVEWVERHRVKWNDRLDRLDQHLRAIQATGTNRTSTSKRSKKKEQSK